MPQNIGTLQSTVVLDTRKAEAQYRRFEQTVNRGLGRNSPFGRLANDTKDFERTLGSATNRVVAFGAAAVVFNTLARSVGAFAQSLVEVDKSLAEINVNLGQSAQGIKQFGADLFNVARQTGQTFDTAAKAAAELARQGLSAEETIKRLKDALILSRISGLDSASAVETLTAAINSFNQEALTSAEVVNKFAAVDTKFAVSSRDIAEAVQRVGSTAQAAGVGINELIALVTSLQQTTARGGSVIGNGLKTIFTRIQAAPETVSALKSVGVAIKDSEGNLRSAIDILRDYARARERLGEAERANLDRTVAGTFQINVLKAALGDLSKEYSVYNNALNIASTATDEAVRKNEQLNQTLASLLNSTAVSVKQLVASISEQDISPSLRGLLKFVEVTRKFLSGESGEAIGKFFGDGIVKGIANVISGPLAIGLGALLFGVFKKIATTIAEEAKSIFQVNSALQTRARIQEQIRSLTRQATQDELAQLSASRSVLEQKQALLNIQRRINQEVLIGTDIQNAFLRSGPLGRSRIGGGLKVPGFADPIASAIAKESAVSGLPRSQIYVDRDPRVANFANPDGILVANRRDEPLGGFQGVNRVIAQGGNPKKGTIPNFADPDNSERVARLLASLRGGTPLRSSELDILRQNLRSKTVSKRLGSLSNIATQILAQNKDLAAEIEASVNQQFVAIYKKNVENLNKKLKSSAFKRIGSILSGRENVAFGDVAEDLKIVESALGRKLKTVEKQVFQEYSKKIETSRKIAVGEENQRAASFDQRQSVSKEEFLLQRREKGKTQAFERLTEKLKSGQQVTNAQRQFIRQELRRRAGIESQSVLSPGALFSGARDTFVAGRSNQQFNELLKQEGLAKRRESLLKAVQRGYSARKQTFAEAIAVGEENQRAASFDQRQSVSKEEFLLQRREKGKTQAFERLTEKLKSGQQVTNAQRQFIRQELRRRAGIESQSVLSPGALFSGARDTFVAGRSNQQFNELLKQEGLAKRRESLLKAVQRGYSARKQTFAEAQEALRVENAFEASQQRRRAKIQELRALQDSRRTNRAFGAALALPFAAGFVPEGQGGTFGGVAGGAITGAAQGAALGLINPSLGPIGATIGALIGGFSKLNKTIEETSAVFETRNQQENAKSETLTQIVNAQQTLASASAEGASFETINKLQDNIDRLTSSLDFELIQKVKDAGGNLEKLSKIQSDQANKVSRLVTSSDAAKLFRGATRESLFGFGAASGASKSEANTIGRAISTEIASQFDRRFLSQIVSEFNAASITGRTSTGQDIGSLFSQGNVNKVAAQLDILRKAIPELGDDVQVTAGNIKQMAQAILESAIASDKFTKALKARGESSRAAAALGGQQFGQTSAIQGILGILSGGVSERAGNVSSARKRIFGLGREPTEAADFNLSEDIRQLELERQIGLSQLNTQFTQDLKKQAVSGGGLSANQSAAINPIVDFPILKLFLEKSGQASVSMEAINETARKLALAQAELNTRINDSIATRKQANEQDKRVIKAEQDYQKQVESLEKTYEKEVERFNRIQRIGGQSSLEGYRDTSRAATIFSSPFEKRELANKELISRAYGSIEALPESEEQKQRRLNFDIGLRQDRLYLEAANFLENRLKRPFVQGNRIFKSSVQSSLKNISADRAFDQETRDFASRYLGGLQELSLGVLKEPEKGKPSPVNLSPENLNNPFQEVKEINNEQLRILNQTTELYAKVSEALSSTNREIVANISGEIQLTSALLSPEVLDSIEKAISLSIKGTLEQRLKELENEVAAMNDKPNPPSASQNLNKTAKRGRAQ